MRALFYHLSLGEMDGTSVVLRRIYSPSAADVHALYFKLGRFPDAEGFISEFIRGEVQWPWRAGARFVRKAWRAQAFSRLVRRSRWVQKVGGAKNAGQLTSLHVVVYDEITAEFARIALHAAGRPPFTLHIMDLLVDHALNETHTPNLLWLLGNASKLVTVSNRLLAQVEPFTAAPTLVWPIPAGISCYDRARPVTDGVRRWQVLMSGAMYAGKAGFLEHVFLPAWKRFHASHPDTELLYIGKDFDSVPPSVRDSVRSLGVLPAEKLETVLRDAAVAVLPVLHEASTPWRYSIPARISDYFAAGLPVIAPLSEGTATHDFFEQVGQPAVTLAATEDDVLETLNRLYEAPAQWLAASHAASAFAREHLDLEKLRAQLFEFMERKTSLPPFNYTAESIVRVDPVAEVVNQK
jgi:glycosyltransferase involved in cell wall biosynthesis